MCIYDKTKKIPKSLRDKYPDIPWKKMAGMRDKLIHEYFEIDKEILWKVARDEVHSLEDLIRNILNILDDK